MSTRYRGTLTTRLHTEVKTHDSVNEGTIGSAASDRAYAHWSAAHLSPGTTSLAGNLFPRNPVAASPMTGAPRQAEGQLVAGSCGVCSASDVHWFTPPDKWRDGAVILFRCCGQLTIVPRRNASGPHLPQSLTKKSRAA